MNELQLAGLSRANVFFFFTSTASSFSLIFVKQNTDLCLFHFLSAFFLSSLSHSSCATEQLHEKNILGTLSLKICQEKN